MSPQLLWLGKERDRKKVEERLPTIGTEPAEGRQLLKEVHLRFSVADAWEETRDALEMGECQGRNGDRPS